MPRDKTYALVCAALAKPGCAICRLERDNIQRYLDGFMYEDVTDVELRARMRAAQGFCREHAAQAVLVRDALGLAIIYQDILSSVDKEMRAQMSAPRLPTRGLLERRTEHPGQRMAKHLQATRSCPACAVRDEMTLTGLQTILDNITDAELGQAYLASDGLCLPHLRRALALAGDKAALETLVAAQSKAMNRLIGELGEFIRKYDHRFRHEAMGSEADSWARALAMVVGETPDTWTKR